MKELEFTDEQLKYAMRVPNPDRMYAIYAAMRRGMSQKRVFDLTNVDPWFLSQFGELLEVEDFMLKFAGNLKGLTKEDLQQVRPLQ